MTEKVFCDVEPMALRTTVLPSFTVMQIDKSKIGEPCEINCFAQQLNIRFVLIHNTVTNMLPHIPPPLSRQSSVLTNEVHSHYSLRDVWLLSIRRADGTKAPKSCNLFYAVFEKNIIINFFQFDRCNRDVKHIPKSVGD